MSFVNNTNKFKNNHTRRIRRIKGGADTGNGTDPEAQPTMGSAVTDAVTNTATTVTDAVTNAATTMGSAIGSAIGISGSNNNQEEAAQDEQRNSLEEAVQDEQHDIAMKQKTSEVEFIKLMQNALSIAQEFERTVSPLDTSADIKNTKDIQAINNIREKRNKFFEDIKTNMVNNIERQTQTLKKNNNILQIIYSRLKKDYAEFNILKDKDDLIKLSISLSQEIKKLLESSPPSEQKILLQYINTLKQNITKIKTNQQDQKDASVTNTAMENVIVSFDNFNKSYNNPPTSETAEEIASLNNRNIEDVIKKLTILSIKSHEYIQTLKKQIRENTKFIRDFLTKSRDIKTKTRENAKFVRELTKLSNDSEKVTKMNTLPVEPLAGGDKASTHNSSLKKKHNVYTHKNLIHKIKKTVKHLMKIHKTHTKQTKKINV